MATSQTKPLSTATREPSRVAAPAVIYSGEALLLAVILGVGLLALAGLALADTGRYSLTAALALAVPGTAALVVVAWRATGRPRLVADRGGLATLAGVTLIAAVLFFPGFAYGIGKDPGAYVSHAMAIARTGSSTLKDPVLDRSRVPRVEVTPEDPVGRFPGIWIKDRNSQHVILQFYHLWPALLASAFKGGGYTGMVNLTPLCGVLAVLAMTLAARRVVGLLGGGLAGLLLATNMLEVWHAKYPSNEVFTQLLVGGALAVAVLIRRTAPSLGRWGPRFIEERRFQLRVGAAVTGVAALLLLLGLLRPWLSGPVYGIFNGQRVRTYDEESMIRLSWFFTLPGLALSLGGLAVVALRRWRAVAWTLVLPAVFLLPLYAYRAEIASRLMWWTRRFVPVIVPGLVVLIAIALGAGLSVAAGPSWRRWLVRAVSAVATISLLVVFATQSLPLRHHQEHGGSFEAVQRIANAAGDRQGVFLWQQPSEARGAAYSFGGAVWLQQGQVSALLPKQPDAAYARSFVRGFPGQPVFLVTSGRLAPRGYASLGLRLADRFTYLMPMWEETYLTRPSKARTVPIPVSIWRIQG